MEEINSALKPDFNVKIKLSLPPDTVEVTIRYAAGVNEDTYSEAEKTINLFVTGANLGFFPLGKVSPSQSFAQMSKIDMIGVLEQHYYLETRNIDARAFRVLLGMLGRLRAKGHPIAEVSVLSKTEAEASIGKEEFLGSRFCFPPLFERIPFSGDWEEKIEFEFERVVQVEFFKDPDRKTIDEIENVFGIWNAIAEKGGYAEFDDDLLKDGFLPGETYMLSKKLLEHTVDRFDTSEIAFRGLINALVRLHETTIAIKKVEVI